MPDTRFVIRAFSLLSTRFVIRALGFLSLFLLPFLWSPVGFSQDDEGTSTSPFAGLRFRENYLKRLASAQRDRRGMRQAPSSNVKSPELTSSKPFALPERSTENR
jgi:hypothetical protein